MAADDGMAAMRRFYEELDAALAESGARCSGCGRCCRFDEADHVLFASALERRYLAASAPAPVVPEGGGDLLARGLRCPYQSGSRCLARRGRALGCRLYHCSWPDPATEEDWYRRWHDRLKRLHDELGVDWDYRPLLPIEKL